MHLVNPPQQGLDINISQRYQRGAPSFPAALFINSPCPGSLGITMQFLNFNEISEVMPIESMHVLGKTKISQCCHPRCWPFQNSNSNGGGVTGSHLCISV